MEIVLGEEVINEKNITVKKIRNGIRHGTYDKTHGKKSFPTTRINKKMKYKKSRSVTPARTIEKIILILQIIKLGIQIINAREKQAFATIEEESVI